MELRRGRRRCYGTLPRCAVLAMELQWSLVGRPSALQWSARRRYNGALPAVSQLLTGAAMERLPTLQWSSHRRSWSCNGALTGGLTTARWRSGAAMERFIRGLDTARWRCNEASPVLCCSIAEPPEHRRSCNEASPEVPRMHVLCAALERCRSCTGASPELQ